MPRRRYPAAVGRSRELRLRRLPELLRLPRRSLLHAELARALAAADELHVLHSDLDPVPVRLTSTTSQSGCYRLRQGDPIDLRVSRLHGRVALSFLHELGHLVDHQLGYEPHDGTFASGSPRRVLGLARGCGEAVLAAAVGTSRSRRRYFLSAKELCGCSAG